jgi:hypothetical protein
MKLVGMADWFRDAGLTVVEEPGWKTRGRHYKVTPYGFQHHTACCAPYPVHKLYADLRIKANFSVQPKDKDTDHPHVHVISAGACNWSTGMGLNSVYKNLLNDIPPSSDARSKGYSWDANKHYVTNETAHPGDGSPMYPGGLEVIDACWFALAKNLGWTGNQLISHAEHTSRKIDPRWNGKRSHVIMNGMRARLHDNLAAGGVTPPQPPKEDDMYKPVKRDDEGPAVAEWQEVLVFALGQDLTYDGGPPNGIDGDYGGKTAAAVANVTGTDGSKIDPSVGALIFGAVHAAAAAYELETTTAEVLISAVLKEKA